MCCLSFNEWYIQIMALFKNATINTFQTSSTLARLENNKNQLIFAKKLLI